MTATKTEKPILFSTELVQAILEGRKSQTRRVVKPQPDSKVNTVHPCKDGEWEFGKDFYNGDGEAIEYKKCPYGKPGDELWVRETFAFLKEHDNKPPSEIYDDQVLYKADGKITNQFGLGSNIHESDFGRWRPSIHMPRRYSRIQLTVEDIRVERVQEISPRDAWAEGVKCKCMKPTPMCKGNIDTFSELWDSINAERGYSWESNPWVWSFSFKVKNIKGLT